MTTRLDSDAKTAPEPDAGRRKLVQLAAAAGGVVAAGALLPQSWQKPIAQIGAVPAHAATSAAAPGPAAQTLFLLRSGAYPPQVSGAPISAPLSIQRVTNGLSNQYFGQFSFTDQFAQIGLGTLNTGAAQVGVGVTINIAGAASSTRNSVGTVTPCTGAITWQTLSGWTGGPGLPAFKDLGGGSGVVTFPFQTGCYINGSSTVSFQISVNGRFSDIATASFNGVVET